MLSCENIWRTPSPSTASESSQDSRFEVLTATKNVPRSYGGYRAKCKSSGSLWVPTKEWLPYYRCSSCREVMSRKMPTKCPQKILTCEHVVCANCIVKSYLIELNPVCPVKDCGKCVNPHITLSAKPSIALPLFFTTDVIPTVEDDLTSDLTAEYHLPRDLFDKERVHYCGDKECEWDGGTLDCGCIDMCRGRCGIRDCDSW